MFNFNFCSRKQICRNIIQDTMHSFTQRLNYDKCTLKDSHWICKIYLRIALISWLFKKERNLSASSREGGHRSDPEKSEPGPEVRIRTQGGNHFADRHIDAFLSSQEKLLKLEQIKLKIQFAFKTKFFCEKAKSICWTVLYLSQTSIFRIQSIIWFRL